jgi:hypothetical protein
MHPRKIVWTPLMLILGASSAVNAKCLVNDSDFNTAGGGCKDLDTGLVWSPDLRALGASNLGVSSANPNSECDLFLNQKPANGGGFTDWRAPTVGEIESALANGLDSHLDYFLNGSPSDFVYRWTNCKTKIKGVPYRYKVRYSDGDTVAHNMRIGSDGNHLICVRGVPADPANDCPGGSRKKNNRGASSALSQTTTGALLLLPLAVVLAARRLRPRRP